MEKKNQKLRLRGECVELLVDNLLHAISKLRYAQFHVVVVPTTRDQKTRQVVAYKRLKTMQNH